MGRRAMGVAAAKVGGLLGLAPRVLEGVETMTGMPPGATAINHPLNRRLSLRGLALRLSGTAQRRLSANAAALQRLADSLEHLNPLAVLGRGYALVRDESGRILSDAATVEPSAPIRVYLAHGRLDAEVTGVDGHEQFARDV